MKFLLFNFFKFLLNSSNKNSGTIILADFPKISFFLYLKILSADLFQKVIGDIVSMRDISEKIVAKRSRAELQKNRELIN